MGELRKCSICNKIFPQTSEYFYADSKKKSGYRSGCKSCLNQKRKEDRPKERKRIKKWYDKNKDTINEKKRERRNKNIEEYRRKESEYAERTREARLERARQYREEHREELRVKAAEYYLNNKEACIQRNKECRKNHLVERMANLKEAKQQDPERFRRYQRKYYSTHKDQLAQKTKEWASANKDKRRDSRQRRRTRMNELPTTLTPDQWNCIKEVFDNKCAYCGAEKQLTQDHFVPLSSGGEYSANNIIPSCGSCNSSKLNKSFFEWYPTYKHYSKKREKRILKYLGYNGDTQQLALPEAKFAS